MKSIEKYLKTLKLKKVKVRVFDKNYDSLKGEPKPNGYDDAFDIMFSSLSYFFFVQFIFFHLRVQIGIYFIENWKQKK